MSKHPVITRPIQDALDDLDRLPKRTVEAGVVKTQDDFGATGQVRVGVFSAAGQWMKRTGYAVAAKVGWTWK